MSLFNVPVLPQNDTPENRDKRARELAQKQQEYKYDYPSIVAGLPMAAAPIPVDLSLDWSIKLATVAIGLGENLVSVLLPNVFSFDVQIPITLGATGASSRGAAQPRSEIVAPEVIDADPKVKTLALNLQDFLSEQRKTLGALAERAHAQKSIVVAGSPGLPDMPPFAPPPPPSRLEAGALPSELADARNAGGWLEQLIKKILDAYLTAVGLLGPATDLRQYAAQFRRSPLPPSAGVAFTDELFAAMRVAGPNPAVLRRATAEDLAAFPISDAQFARVTGEAGATLKGATDRLYIVDYKALSSIVPGTNPQQKYLTTPKALFYVPSAEAGRRSLRPLAIKVGQEAASPVFFPDDGLSWSIARIMVNVADLNDHELVSHLALTHLVTEPFVLATARQLDARHPLNVLLTPHFAGTLLINYAAQTSLIAPGGTVELLLAGTITSSNELAANAVKAVRYNQTFFPQTLEARGVSDRNALPDYPYRDDALALWDAIHRWVSDYVGIYYGSDADVAGDYELQAWVQELAKEGQIQDIGEGAPGAPAQIATVGYLATLLTQVIFTASVQHAAVNFPQRTLMSYAPAAPLAGFAAFPAAPGAKETTLLDVLAPLSESILQQALMMGLGGVYHTTLGMYGGQLSDLRARSALRSFQEKLQEITEQINYANAQGERTAYTTLLPAFIPQSINI